MSTQEFTHPDFSQRPVEIDGAEVLISREEIEQLLDEAANFFAPLYMDTGVRLIGVLNGAAKTTIRLAEKLRERGVAASYDFMRLTSYKNGEKVKSAEVDVWPKTSIKDVDTLLVEDIIDEGDTMETAHLALETQKPASLRSFALLSKMTNRKTDYQPTKIGREVEGWVFGYGMDRYNEDERPIIDVWVNH